MADKLAEKTRDKEADGLVTDYHLSKGPLLPANPEDITCYWYTAIPGYIYILMFIFTHKASVDVCR